MNIYNFRLKNVKYNPVIPSDLPGKALLMANSAAVREFTPQYSDLQHKKNSDYGNEQ